MLNSEIQNFCSRESGNIFVIYAFRKKNYHLHILKIIFNLINNIKFIYIYNNSFFKIILKILSPTRSLFSTQLLSTYNLNNEYMDRD